MTYFVCREDDEIVVIGEPDLTLEKALEAYNQTKVGNGKPVAIRETGGAPTQYRKFSDPPPIQAGRRNRWRSK